MLSKRYDTFVPRGQIDVARAQVGACRPGTKRIIRHRGSSSGPIREMRGLYHRGVFTRRSRILLNHFGLLGMYPI